MALTKEQIIGHAGGKREAVEAFGGTVFIKTMSGIERDGFELACFGQGGSKDNLRSKLLVRCLVDENGKRYFADDEHNVLGKQDSVTLDRLFDVARRVNGIGQSEVEQLKKS